MRSLKLLVAVPFLVAGLAGCSDSPDDESTTFSEETIVGAAPGKGDGTESIEFREFDFYVPTAEALQEPTRKMITTAASFERVFGEPPPFFLRFDREWMVFYSAGTQAASGISVSVDAIQVAESGKSLQVVTRQTEPGTDCRTTAAEYAPFKMVTFPAPDLAPQAVRYYADDAVSSCSVSQCEAHAFSLIAAASEGVNYTSEGDASFEPMIFAASATQATDDAALLETLGEPAGELIDVDSDFVGWFEFQVEVDDPDDLGDVREAAAYENIRDTFVDNFSNLRIVRVGEVEVRVYLVGETECGDLAVLKTISIET